MRGSMELIKCGCCDDKILNLLGATCLSCGFAASEEYLNDIESRKGNFKINPELINKPTNYNAIISKKLKLQANSNTLKVKILSKT